MNIYTATQNTVAQFQGLIIENAIQVGSLWTIRIARGEMSLTFQIDETVGVACVMERKNIGRRSMSRFMNAFMEEVQSQSEDEDPLPPPRD